ncbi:MAG TPA: D-alanyl-D-alanine carboxypeptidase family protein [Clostridia bacterium]|nr:D-alanyl-D-alanine carboxypeptidase family protein [Clostridia bacterium]
MMKSRIKTALAILICLCILIFSHPVYALGPVNASGAVLMEANSNRVLYSKNPHKRLPMASTTKIMTAIIAIENSNPEETVTVGANAVGVEGSSIYLQAGEKLKLGDLLYGLMLASGNDAAVAIAEHVGGSVERFVEMMNKKAQELGLKNTHFTNPSGLHNPNHYTSAYDLAKLACYGMKNEMFREITSTKVKRIPWQGRDYPRFLRNKNRILNEYAGGNGIKTGFTKAAGRCLVASAQRNGMQLVCAVINAPDMFADCMAMMDWGFENYKLRELVKAGEVKATVGVVGNKRVKSVDLVTAQDFKYIMSEDEANRVEYRVNIPAQRLYAPVSLGQDAGVLEIYADGDLIGKVKLKAKNMVKADDLMYNLREFFKWLFMKGKRQ